MGAIETDVTKEKQFFTGEDRTFEYLCVDASDVELDVSSYALTWELKRSLGSPTAVLTKTKAAGEIVITSGTGTNDVATVTLTDEDTEDLPSGRYFHVLRRTNAGSESWMSFGEVILTSSGQT